MRRGHNVVRNIVAEKFARSAFDSDESDESLPHPHQPRHTRNAQLKKIATLNVSGYIGKKARHMVAPLIIFNVLGTKLKLSAAPFLTLNYYTIFTFCAQYHYISVLDVLITGGGGGGAR
jgi:hypothetical protein